MTLATDTQLVLDSFIRALSLPAIMDMSEAIPFLEESIKGNTELDLEESYQKDFVKAYIKFLQKECNLVATLYVEADYDFTLVYPCGKQLCRFHDITIPIYSLEDLKRIKFIKGKTTEVNEGLERILANPTQDFDNTGGNRGLHYTYIGDFK